MTRVLVAGSTGGLGRHILRELDRRGFIVRALCRSRSRARGLPATVEVVEADALDPRALAGVAHGIDVVFSCLGQTVSPDLAVRGPGYLDVDVPANLNLLAEAKRAGVRRFAYVSALHAGRFPACAYLDAHARVADAVKNSGLEYGIVEPTGFFSQFGALLDMAQRGHGVCFGDGQARSNPIDDAELASLCADLIDGVGSMVVEAGGPEILTRRQMTEAAFAALGVAPRFWRLPLALLGVSGRLCRSLAPRISDLSHFFHLLSTHDFIAPVYGARPLSAHFKTLCAARAIPSSDSACQDRTRSIG